MLLGRTAGWCRGSEQLHGVWAAKVLVGPGKAAKAFSPGALSLFWAKNALGW